MKKIFLAIAIALLGIFGLVSCADKDGNKTDKKGQIVADGTLPKFPFSNFIGKGENGEDLAFTAFPQLDYFVAYEDALNAHFRKKYKDIIKSSEENKFLSKELYEFLKKEKLYIYSFNIFTFNTSKGRRANYSSEQDRALMHAYMYYLPQLQTGKITQEEFKNNIRRNIYLFIDYDEEKNIILGTNSSKPNYEVEPGYVKIGFLRVHHKTFLPKTLTEEEFNKQIQKFKERKLIQRDFGTKEVYFNFDK